MEFLSESKRRTLRAVSRMAYCNPFEPCWLDFESEIFKLHNLQAPPPPSSGEDLAHPRGEHASFQAIDDYLAATLGELCRWLQDNRRAMIPAEDRPLYVDAADYLVYRKVRHAMDALIAGAGAATAQPLVVRAWDEFCREYDRFSAVFRLRSPRTDPAHMFALCFQIRRAIHYIARYIIGRSRPMGQLRAAAWQSIFTCDVRRFLYSLYDCLGNTPTLIVGPSGTGKELVARAIAFSRYCRFCPQSKTFADFAENGFHAVNLSAVPGTLIESQLFGHRRGAFTGAVCDQPGIFERCGASGTVFLDEIGDLDGALQVKLLRVLQTRRFLPVGSIEELPFDGKILAATNRDLATGIDDGSFREDLYFRLCGDVVVTPSLREQLADCDEDLHTLIQFILNRELGGHLRQRERTGLANEITLWIRDHIGSDYTWPGNIRELEQCMRNVLIHGEYRPVVRSAASPLEELVDSMKRGSLTMERLEAWYCSLVFAATGSYVETARRLDLDRRTISKRIDAGILERVQAMHRAPKRATDDVA